MLETEPSEFYVVTFLTHTCTHQVKGIVQQNIHKVIERGEKLDDVGDKAGI